MDGGLVGQTRQAGGDCPYALVPAVLVSLLGLVGDAVLYAPGVGPGDPPRLWLSRPELTAWTALPPHHRGHRR